jgi:hypothetical protein
MAIESQGTDLFWGTTAAGATSASTSTSVLIGQVAGFNGPSGSANVIDITHLGSTAKEKMMGLRDEGQISLDVMFQPNDVGQIALRTDRANRQLRKVVVKLNDNTSDAARTKIICDAYCTGFSITGRVDDKISGSVTLELAGACTYSSVIT